MPKELMSKVKGKAQDKKLEKKVEKSKESKKGEDVVKKKMPVKRQKS